MELLQESQVCAVEQTNIIHAVAHHYQSVKTDIHIESGKFIRIKTCCAEYIRVRRTAGHYLYPSDMLANAAALAAAYKTAHIYLKAGFNKGEEAGAHPYGYITAENLGKYAFYHYLTCCEGEITVNDKSLILIESSFMAGIGSFVAVNMTGINKAVRGLVCLHIAHTSSCQMRTEAKLFICITLVVSLEPVCIHAFAGRMIRREIKVVEGIHFACDIVLLKYLKAH